jgi:glycosyltransferase involved in cell wall biosynthesis
MTYNQAEYVREAIAGALAQTYEPLEIVISDDASTDGTVDVIKQALADYSGPHKIVANFNPKNLGIGAHVNKIFELATGELLVFAAGDDISLPARAQRIVDCWIAHDRRPDAIYCSAQRIDANGANIGHYRPKVSEARREPEYIISYVHTRGALLLGACAAYSRRLLDLFGPLDSTLEIEDTPLTVRASLAGGVEYVDADLVKYRTAVSVWYPRKLANESFEYHLSRVSHLANARNRVFKQILADATKMKNADAVAAANRRFSASQFIDSCFATRQFSISRYFSTAMSSGNWRASFYPAALNAAPWLHRKAFQFGKLLGRVSRR